MLRFSLKTCYFFIENMLRFSWKTCCVFIEKILIFCYLLLSFLRLEIFIGCSLDFYLSFAIRKYLTCPSTLASLAFLSIHIRGIIAMRNCNSDNLSPWKMPLIFCNSFVSYLPFFFIIITHFLIPNSLPILWMLILIIYIWVHDFYQILGKNLILYITRFTFFLIL